MNTSSRPRCCTKKSSCQIQEAPASPHSLPSNLYFFYPPTQLLQKEFKSIPKHPRHPRYRTPSNEDFSVYTHPCRR